MKRAANSGLIASALVFGLVGCGGGEIEPRVPMSRYGESHLNWADCPAELGGATVQCTQVQVPLNWDDSDAGFTSILLRKVGADGEARGNLWALDGGPGFAGDSFLNETIIDLSQGAKLNLMIPSHRGSIGESALVCAGQRSESDEGGRVSAQEWPACLRELQDKWGEGLSAFTVRQAALDVAYLVQHASNPGKSYVFGGSYGTLWAHRLLLDTSAQLDGVLLDSIVPIGASLERVDAHADRAAEEVLRSCSELEACARRFEGDPVSLSREAMSAYARGDGCGSESIAVVDVQHAVHGLLNGAPDSWIKLVALFERLVRCDSKDKEALIGLLGRTDAPKPPATDSEPTPVLHYNALLNRHILFRELYRFDVTSQERQEFEASALAVGPNSALVAEEANAFGADYRQLRDPARTSSPVPTYLLSGRLDPLDPPVWAEEFAQTLSSGHLLEIKWAGHSTLRYLDWGEGGCGRQIFSTFLSGAPDFDCIMSHAEVDLGQEESATQQMIAQWWTGDEGAK